MKCDIDKIFEYLSWDNSDEIQRHGIDMASQIRNLSVLIMPIENKSIWENCAKVLVEKSDEELELYFAKLFEWLQDMNWPGADFIYDRLIDVLSEKSENFLFAYQYSILLAEQTGDKVWKEVLTDFYIEYILNMLDWHKSYEIQLKGREMAKTIESIEPFLQPVLPKYNKNVWENCAIILSEKTDEELKPYLSELLEWLQDMNWPGAFCILDRLQKYSDDNSINSAINICIEKAKASNDEVWEDNLHVL